MIASPAHATGRATPSRSWLQPFNPRTWLRNGHLQTIAGNFLRRSGTMPPLSERLVVPVEPAHRFIPPSGPAVEVPPSSVLCLCHWQPAAMRNHALTVVLIHGLEGSANSGYILGNTIRLWQQGCNVVRMNMRSCGGSDELAPTIYHSGRSEDVAAVVDTLAARGLERVALIGYSMGGNLAFRYAGQQALLPASQRNPSLCALAGVSPLLDLAPSSAALHLPGNRLYEQRFLRAMKKRLRTKARLFPALYAALEQEGVYAQIRTMRDFDGEIVARYGGFADAADYYEQVRASHFAADLHLPTLVLYSLDDPFIRTTPQTRDALLANPNVEYIETRHGGHCAFLSQPGSQAGNQPDTQGRWAEETLAQWLLHQQAQP
jgi:predicted alpha/beta-fold hydrolase